MMSCNIACQETLIREPLNNVLHNYTGGGDWEREEGSNPQVEKV